MEFEITHTTTYSYGQPAAEAYVEARLTPPSLPTQRILSHVLTTDPRAPLSSYKDYFGNQVDFFSLPFRHHQLVIANALVVQTLPPEFPCASLALPLADARQILASSFTDVFEYLQHTPAAPSGKDSALWARQHLRANAPLGDALASLNDAIHDHFTYSQGATDSSTPLSEVWKHRKGVCQDFAHVALSVLRAAGLPSRYVCGYIESRAPALDESTQALVGAIATHAWVEVLVPGMTWVALDPTNRQWADERYVAVSFGRDSRDAAPLRGTFKGSNTQKMDVQVFMRRKTA